MLIGTAEYRIRNVEYRSGSFTSAVRYSVFDIRYWRLTTVGSWQDKTTESTKITEFFLCVPQGHFFQGIFESTVRKMDEAE